MKMFRLLMILPALLVLAGCSISINRTVRSSPPTVVFTDQDPTLREVHAAGGLSHESNRFARLRSIAQRDDLGSAAQSYLIKTAAHELSHESNRFAVFVTLIENPAMNEAGRNAILDHLNNLRHESNRVAVLNKLDRVRSRPEEADQLPPPEFR